MFRTNIVRQATRAIRTTTFNAAPVANPATRAFSKIAPKFDKVSPDDPKDETRHDKFTTASTTETGHEGSASRTDDSFRFEHPDDESELPSSKPVQGRGRNLRTLASFSLEDKVGVVTGGARGLGLVMSQAMVVSGADVAIVDMNSEYTLSEHIGCGTRSDSILQRTRVRSRPKPWSRSSRGRTLAQRTYQRSPHTTPMSRSPSL
jgi:D-arabinitol 2-dehydrogenase